MVHKHCCYGVCRSDSRHRERSHMVGVGWIPFSKPSRDLEKCRKWIKLCGRPIERFNIEKVNKDTYICTKHFVGGQGPTKEYPDPIPAAASETEERHFLAKKSRNSPAKRRMCHETGSTSRAGRKTMKTLEQHAEFLSSLDATVQAAELDAGFMSSPGGTGGEEVHVLQVLNELSPQKENLKAGASGEARETPKLLRYVLSKETEIFKPTMTTIGTQTTVARKSEDGKSTVLHELTDEELACDTKTLKRSLFMANVFRNDQKCRFYTGLSLVLFNAVLALVSRAAKNMDYWRGEQTGNGRGRQLRHERLLNLREELLLTLVRLRRGFPLEAIADLMCVSTGHCSRVFVTWIHLLARQLGRVLVKWPSKRQVQRKLPHAFQNFKRTRCIIDCTEFMLQKPSLPSVQRKSYSNYKHRNTGKCLVAVTPRGTFSFVSDLWTGSISDRKIVERSGFLDLIEPQDDVMADRGFTIRDLLTIRGATLNIPPFTQGKQMSQAAVTKNRRIAAVRIHVERAIGRLKAFRLIGETVPAQLNPILNECVVVAAALCNLDTPLCK